MILIGSCLFQDVVILTMSSWCQLGVGEVGRPTGCGPAAVLWATRGTSVSAARPVSSGQIQRGGPTAPANPALAEGAAVTHILETVTPPMRPQQSGPVLWASTRTPGTLATASNVPVQTECPALSGTGRASLNVTSVHSEPQVEHFHSFFFLLCINDHLIINSIHHRSQVPAVTSVRRVSMATLRDTAACGEPVGPASVMDTSESAFQEVVTAAAANVSSV